MRRQLLLPIFTKVVTTHGGEKARRGRKLARPIAVKRAMHLCLRSNMARGVHGLRTSKNYKRVATIVREEARKNEVRIEIWANVGNHLHFMLRVSRREHFQNFLRAMAGRIAMAVTGAKKGKPLGRRFWDELAFTRALTSRREETLLEEYVHANVLETISKFDREMFLAERSEARKRWKGD